MGVPGLFSYVRSNYADVLTELKEKTINGKSKVDVLKFPVDVLCYDLNGIIHQACQRVYEYGKYARLAYPKGVKVPLYTDPKNKVRCFSEIWRLIEEVFDTVQPKKRVIICIDGVAGKAKMMQQRSRRYRGGIEREEKIKTGELKKYAGKLFDGASITPGTEFLSDLSKFIHSQIKVYMSGKWSYLEDIIFSDEKVPGEGEHGLISYIRHNVDYKNLYSNPSDSYCIHGSDADLVMLSLGLHLPKMYILRDSDKPQYQKYHVINIHKLYAFICGDLMRATGQIKDGRKVGKKPDFSNKKPDRSRRYYKKSSRAPDALFPGTPGCKELIEDFVFFTFLIGNDFLPHSPSIDIFSGGLDALFYFYRNLGNSRMVIRDRENAVMINKEALIKFLRCIVKEESNLLTQTANDESLFPDPLLQKHSKTTLENDVSIVNVDYEKFKDEYNKTKFNEDKIQNACKSYIEGLEWVLRYYFEGIPSYDWYFPYLYTPFASDILKEVESHQYVFYGVTRPLSPWEQLLSVLPPQGRGLIPKELRHIMDNKKYYPDTIKIDKGRVHMDWQAVLILPLVPDGWVQDQFRSVKLKSAALNTAGPSKRYRFTSKLVVEDIWYM